MKVEKNQIITLENKKKYLIVNDTIYDGKYYYLGVGVNPKETDITDDVIIIEKLVEKNETYVKIIKDVELISILTNLLKPIDE